MATKHVNENSQLGAKKQSKMAASSSSHAPDDQELFVGQIFGNFQDFETSVRNYGARHNTLFVIENCRKSQFNEGVYEFVKLVCKQGGRFRKSLSKGIRNRHCKIKCGCPVMVRAVSKKCTSTGQFFYHITKVILDHNHQVSEEIYQAYPENRRPVVTENNESPLNWNSVSNLDFRIHAEQTQGKTLHSSDNRNLNLKQSYTQQDDATQIAHTRGKARRQNVGKSPSTSSKRSQTTDTNVSKSKRIKTELIEEDRDDSTGTNDDGPTDEFKFSGDLTFEEFRQEKFIRDRNWHQFHSPRNVLLAMVGEVGELAEILHLKAVQQGLDANLKDFLVPCDSQWKGEVSEGLPELSEKEREHVGQEISDVLLYLMDLSVRCRIDLPSAVQSKMEANGKKYPVDKAFGRANKYTDYQYI